MNTRQKLALLEESYPNEVELDQILTKLLDVAKSQQKQTLERYERELQDFERRYGMMSATFYQRFSAGTLGDEMDFFEWAGVFELREYLQEKIQKLENVR